MKQTLTHFKNYYPTCGKNKIISDEFSGESLCRRRGLVVSEKNVDEDAEWRAFAGDEKNRTRIGDHTSILTHDMVFSPLLEGQTKIALEENFLIL